MLQDEYYVIESNRDSCLFSWDQKSGEFSKGKPVHITEPVKVRLGEPIPEKPKFVDFHVMAEPVVSQRIYDVLEPLDIYGIQLVPAKVRNPTDPFDEPRDYWFLHVWNSISCLDKEQSELEYSRRGGRILGIEKLVLHEKTLELFELRQRQIFYLTEKSSVLLVHKSIKEAVESIQPSGLRFFKAADWNSDISFT